MEVEEVAQTKMNTPREEDLTTLLKKTEVVVLQDTIQERMMGTPPILNMATNLNQTLVLILQKGEMVGFLRIEEEATHTLKKGTILVLEGITVSIRTEGEE